MLPAIAGPLSHPAEVDAPQREFAALDGVVGVIVGIVALISFVCGLRAMIASVGDQKGRIFAHQGLSFVVVAAPVYLVSSALGAVLVQAASGDPATFATLFRLYNVMYEAGADILEGAWSGAFSLAILLSAQLRWLGWLGLIVAVLRWVKAFVPDQIRSAASSPLRRDLERLAPRLVVASVSPEAVARSRRR